MNPFEKELTAYLDQSEARGNKVISINGVRAMLERHQNDVKPPTRVYPSTVDYLHDRELQRSIAASRSRH